MQEKMHSSETFSAPLFLVYPWFAVRALAREALPLLSDSLTCAFRRKPVLHFAFVFLHSYFAQGSLRMHLWSVFRLSCVASPLTHHRQTNRSSRRLRSWSLSSQFFGHDHYQKNNETESAALGQQGLGKKSPLLSVKTSYPTCFTGAKSTGRPIWLEQMSNCSALRILGT